MIDWFKANKLSLNLNKTVGIKFWDNKNPFMIHVDNMTIQMAEHTKFLGVYCYVAPLWLSKFKSLY